MNTVAPQVNLAASQTDQPTVSAVIPVHNSAATIERAVQSVLAQTYSNLIEVIVVDDGSTDDTAATVAGKFPQVTLIERANGGNAAARNTGAKAACGEYVAFLDADDEWTPDHVSVLIATKSWCVGADLLLCQAAVDRAGTLKLPWLREGLHTLTLRDWITQTPFTMGFSSCCSGWVMSRELFAAVGGFDESLRQCVDAEFVLRFTSLGHSIVGVAYPGYKRFIQKESVSRGALPSVRGPMSYCTVLRAFEPDGAHLSGRLLSRMEYEGALKQALVVAAQALVAAGRTAEAREYFAEARTLRGGSKRLVMAIALGAVVPGALSWFGRKVWLPLRKLGAVARLSRSYGRAWRNGAEDACVQMMRKIP